MTSKAPKTLLETFTDWKPVTIRFPAPDFQRLKDRHAETYGDHRLSFNAWILSRIELSFNLGG
tara:strand:- start:56 stop:244 length:189 start_codon:yes stop_codon:yes gene_type:complete